MYATLKTVIKAKYGQDACNVGDEGGFAPSIQSNYEGELNNLIMHISVSTVGLFFVSKLVAVLSSSMFETSHQQVTELIIFVV